MTTHKIVFLRHGESVWNVSNIFTGWEDVDLSPTGELEAIDAGKLLKEKGYKFDIVFTSVLKRSIKTAWVACMNSENFSMPVFNHWRLNERHYGGLQGMNKAETAAKHGDEQVKTWRRSYDIPPPEIEQTDPRHPSNDPKYAGVPQTILPGAESLALVVDRVLPYWADQIAPCVKAGRTCLVAAHGNSLRALCKYLEGMSEKEVLDFNIPTAVPLVYELDADLKFIKKYYLMDPDEVAKKIAAVANQGKAGGSGSSGPAKPLSTLRAGGWNGVRGEQLKGKVAIVTGAGSSGPGWGTGKAIAVAMAREGAKVGLVDMNTTAAEETAAIIREEGGECAVLPKCDISKWDEVIPMVNACEQTLGSINVLVNNVGIVWNGDVTSVELRRWELVNNVNLIGCFNCTKACVEKFLKGSGGNVVNVSSISSLRALRNEVAYASSKGGVNSMALSVAREFAGRGVRCNTIMPGIIETPLVANAASGQDIEKIMAERHAQSPTGRMGDAWDIAHAALYLASDAAKYTNGLHMPVDGAFTQQVLPHAKGAVPLKPLPPPTAPVNSSSRLAGKVAIVTGASSDFGRAITALFRTHGATIFTDSEKGMETAEEVEALVAKCKAQHGKVNILVNGGGIVSSGKGLEATSPADFVQFYRRKATVNMYTMRFAIPQMLEAGGGAIVNISSISALRYVEPDLAGAAAAGSVNTQTVQTAAEFADRGIRCNALIPFVFGSQKGAPISAGHTADIAMAALHLCSDEARYTNGQLINVDMSAGMRVTVNA